MDEEQLDLSAWEPPPPPDVADAVIERMRRAPLPDLVPEPVRRRSWLVPAALGLGVGACAAVTVLLLGRADHPTGTGIIAGSNARHVELPVGTADVDPGADVTWHDDTAVQADGTATYHVDGHLTIGAADVSIDARDANLRVDVDGAKVGVVVYSGRVDVTQGDQTRALPAGSAVALGQPARPPALPAATDPHLAHVAELEKRVADLQAELEVLRTPGALDTDTFRSTMRAHAGGLATCAHPRQRRARRSSR